MPIQAVSGYVSRGNVILIERKPDGSKHERVFYSGYYAYVRECPKDQRPFKGIVRAGRWVRLEFKSWEDRNNWRIRNPHLETFEADCGPMKRVLADNDIVIQRPTRAYIDIETDSRCTIEEAITGKARVLTWALVDEQGWPQQRVLEGDTDWDEGELLKSLYEALDGFDQAVAWGMETFDELALKERSKVLGIKVPRHVQWMDQLACFRRLNLQVAKTGEEKTSFKLEAIAQALLGEGKHKATPEVLEKFGNKPLGSIVWDMWRAGGVLRQQMANYCLQDADLCRRIEEVTQYLETHFTICEVCNVFQNSHTLKPTAQMDGWFLRNASRAGNHLPSSALKDENDETEPEQYEGAYVMRPNQSGIIKDVRVLDFAGLYPNIIRTFNLDRDTKVTKDWLGDCCVTPENNVYCRTDRVGEGPKALAGFANMRAEWKKKKKDAGVSGDVAAERTADRKQNAYKVLANSYYGILGSRYSRFFDLDLAEGVTSTGRWLIQSVGIAAVQWGGHVLYCDTDGLFFTGLSHEQTVEFTRYVNDEFLPRLAHEQGCVQNFLSVEYQETFERIVFPLSDDGEPAAKKYCAKFLLLDGRPVEELKIEIKGLEVKRGDALGLARQMQQETIDLLVKYCCEDPDVYVELVERWMKRIGLDKLRVEDIVLSQAVKELSSYKTTKKDGTPMQHPAHVRVAKELKDRGQDVSRGTKIGYIVTNATTTPITVIPVEDFTGEFDRTYVWNRVYPPTMRLLMGAFSNRNWIRWEAKQSKSKKHRVLPGQLKLVGLENGQQ